MPDLIFAFLISVFKTDYTIAGDDLINALDSTFFTMNHFFI